MKDLLWCGPGGRASLLSLRPGLFQMKTIILFLLLAASVNAQEAEVFSRINSNRRQNSLPELTYNKDLEKAARFHAEWMAANRRMEHLQPPPRSLEEHKTCNHHPANRAINAGYVDWETLFRTETTPNGVVVHARPGADEHIGEIIAAGWNAGNPSGHVSHIVAGWMKSPGHRQEILTRHYREMGIWISTNGNDTFWCVVFGKGN